MDYFRKGILAFHCLLTSVFAKEAVTNPYRTDGFGSQYQTIIYAAMYAELNHKTFLYTPFRHLEHNYKNDEDFLEKKEWLVNMRDHFPINHDDVLQRKNNASKYIKFFEKHVTECAYSDVLKKIKQVFRQNKNINQYFNENYLNVAVHVRRPNAHDNRIEGTNIADTVYLNIIHTLRKKYSDKNPQFHIYSQGDIENFTCYQRSDVVLHINESIEDTFTSMVFADVLVTSQSALSYTAALLSDGIVYYMPYAQSPLPRWLKLHLKY